MCWTRSFNFSHTPPANVPHFFSPLLFLFSNVHSTVAYWALAPCQALWAVFSEQSRQSLLSWRRGCASSCHSRGSCPVPRPQGSWSSSFYLFSLVAPLAPSHLLTSFPLTFFFLSRYWPSSYFPSQSERLEQVAPLTVTISSFPISLSAQCSAVSPPLFKWICSQGD